MTHFSFLILYVFLILFFFNQAYEKFNYFINLFNNQVPGLFKLSSFFGFFSIS